MSQIFMDYLPGFSPIEPAHSDPAGNVRSPEYDPFGDHLQRARSAADRPSDSADDRQTAGNDRAQTTQPSAPPGQADQEPSNRSDRSSDSEPRDTPDADASGASQAADDGSSAPEEIADPTGDGLSQNGDKSAETAGSSREKEETEKKGKSDTEAETEHSDAVAIAVQGSDVSVANAPGVTADPAATEELVPDKGTAKADESKKDAAAKTSQPKPAGAMASHPTTTKPSTEDGGSRQTGVADQEASAKQAASAESAAEHADATEAGQAAPTKASSSQAATAPSVDLEADTLPKLPQEPVSGPERQLDPHDGKAEPSRRTERKTRAAAAERAAENTAQNASNEPAAQSPAINAATDSPVDDMIRSAEQPTARGEQKFGAAAAETARPVPEGPTQTAPTESQANAPQRLSSASAGGSSQAHRADASGQVDRVRFVQRVARAFETLGDRNGPVRLRLSPPELGSLRLEISVRDGAMTARVEAETQAARSLLLDNLPLLRDRLARQDIQIEQFNVDLAGHTPGGWPNQTSGHSQPDGGGASSRTPKAKAAEGVERIVAADPGAARRAGEGSRLNVIV